MFNSQQLRFRTVFKAPTHKSSSPPPPLNNANRHPSRIDVYRSTCSLCPLFSNRKVAITFPSPYPRYLNGMKDEKLTRQSDTCYYYEKVVAETRVLIEDRASRVSMQVEPDVSVNLAAFFLKSIGLWTSDDPAYESRRKVILVYTIWCIMLSSVVIGRDVYFTWFYDGVGTNI